ncbi:DUF6283 family protein [Actinomadura viridis]|uniref:DUF6283 family protein n=1 Tax=Actinomadura viridis TaxID=58110 RepID=UPI0036CC93C5
MSCPYRRDAPSGVWAREEYEKLPRYDAPTIEQPTGVFICHQYDHQSVGSRVCAGWAGCHDGDELLALRIAVLEEQMSPEQAQAIRDYSSPVALFGSGSEAAEHGLAELDRPGSRAVEAIDKITRVRGDLR